MIRKILPALLLATASPAFAGGAAEPAPGPVIVPSAPVSDWTGGYVGLQFGTTFDGTYTTVVSERDLEADVYGVFGGYRFDLGTFVVGGELDYMVGEGNIGAPAAFDFDVDSLVRLGIEGGYDFGNVLAYVTAGFASTQLTDQFGTTIDSDGYFYGFGADMRVSDRVTVGVEVLQHEFDDFGIGATIEALTFGLNVAFTF